VLTQFSSFCRQAAAEKPVENGTGSLAKETIAEETEPVEEAAPAVPVVEGQ
jgi:hypothetical protein